MRSTGQSIKTAIAVFLVAAGFVSCSLKLMKVQLAEGDTYEREAAITSEYKQSITSSRGEIVDATGKVIVGNKVGYNVIIKPEKFPSDNTEGNGVILNIVNLLKKNNINVEESLPISDKKPYTFTTNDKDEQKKVKSKLKLNVYATADNCISKLYDDYDISKDYSESDRRLIAGIRYEMLARDFSMSTEFTLAQDIDKSLIADIEELGMKYPGVDIEESALREIEDGNIVPHEIGSVGPIYAEEYDSLKDKGYNLDDIVGKSGIEKAMEDELRGTDGERTIVMEDGKVKSSEVTTSPKNGNTVKLTVNGEFQKGLQEILSNFITNFPSLKTGLTNVNCGAIAVVDCTDGSVLGLATNPTYDLIQYKTNYNEILNAENTPLVNRATTGLYRPGSTFKVITATAGLNEGLVDQNTVFNCAKKYEYMGQMYNCTGYHGDISIERALMVSCNIYFYHLSELLTIDRISDYAKQFGLAQKTGIETSDAAGRIGDQETYSALGQTWTIGQVLQTGIGNSETAVTPLQMACVAATIANKGVRYEPHIVDSIWNYDMTKMIEKKTPTIAQTIPTKIDSTWDIVKEGMVMASHNGLTGNYSLSNLGYRVAIKTGTPQLDARVQDSLFIGFAPADDPKIAFCGVIEGGESSKYMIRPLLRLYEKVYGGFDGSTAENDTTEPATTETTVSGQTENITTAITSSGDSANNDAGVAGVNQGYDVDSRFGIEGNPDA